MPAKSAKRPPTQRDFKHTWFVVEWMQQADPPLRQRDMINQLGWSRAKASAVVNGEQQYTQALIDELTDWLHARPWELLMHPREAMAIRGLRESAAVIVASDEVVPSSEEAARIHRELREDLAGAPKKRSKNA